MTTIINTKIGVAKGGVARIWIEGQKLIHGGIRIGAEYVLRSDAVNKRLEMVEASDATQGDAKFTVSKRERNGVIAPLLEIRTDLIAKVFAGCEKVRVAIRAGRIIISALQIEVKIRERLERIKRKLASKERLSCGSLFHGGGVLDSALHRGLMAAGIAAFIQVGVEIESEYLDSSLRNNPDLWTSDSIAINSDIQDLCLGATVPQLDLVVGGVPCTGASVSGRAKNKLKMAEDHSSAGSLFYDYLEFVKASNPALVLLENVPQYANTASMSVIRSKLTQWGYKVYETVLSGPQFGAIEARDRLVMVAVTVGFSSSEFVFPNTHPSVLSGVVRKLGDVLEDVPLDSDRWKSYDYLVEKEKSDIAKGKGFRRQLVTADSTIVGTIGRGYAKARSTEPFVQHPTDPLLSRLLSEVEHARVKGIPEHTAAGVSSTIAHEIYGQSVIYTVFEAVGFALGCYALGVSMPDVYFNPALAVASEGPVGDEVAEEASETLTDDHEPVQADLLVA